MESNYSDEVSVLAPSTEPESSNATAKAADLRPGARIVDPLLGRDVLVVERTARRRFPHGERVYIEARNTRTKIKITRTIGVKTSVEVAS